MKSVRYTNQILVISGSVIEVYDYKEPVRVDPLPQSRRYIPPRDGLPKKDHREASSVYRSRKRLRRLLNANTHMYLKKSGKPFKPIFITFTFRENMTDITQANYAYKKFMQCFNYFLFQEKKSRLKYVVAIEFQKRGAIHYHAIYFNLPYRKPMKTDIAELWSHGFVKVKGIKHIKDVGNYIMKYITKEQFDKRLVGKKCYFRSRNLFESVEIKNSDKIKMFLQFAKPEGAVYKKSIDNPQYGPKYLYRRFTTKDLEFVRSFLDLFVKPGYLDPKL